MPRKRKKKPGTDAWWSDNQRIQLVTTYLATGNLSLSAATMEIPARTARRWKAMPWFKQMVEDIRSEENIQLDSKLAKVVDKSVEALLDRVENGDFQYDQREGRMIRKPISARDASTVTRDMIDRRELLQGKKQKENDNSRKMEDRLLKLAEEFGKFARSKTIEAIPETTYKEIINGV